MLQDRPASKRKEERAMRKVLAFVLVIILAAAVNQTAWAKKGERLKIGDEFPMFFLKHINGNNFFLNEYVGGKAIHPCKGVIFSFCASYCKPCKKEIPELDKLRDKYGSKGLEIFLVNSGEDRELALGLIKEVNTKIPVLLDRYLVVLNMIGQPGIPHTVLIDKACVVRFINTGFAEDNSEAILKELEHAVEDVLGITSGGSNQ